MQHEQVPQPPVVVLKSPSKSKTKIIELKWKYGGKAPFKNSWQSMTEDEGVVYLTSDWNVFSYNSSTGKWNTELQPCPQICGSLAILHGLLTMVGGWLSSDDKPTNKLVSLTKREGGKWIEPFPPMPTSRRYSTTSMYQNHLIVAGGSSTFFNDGSLDVVEILNIHTFAWSTASTLPHPLVYGSATLCGNRLYILGGEDKDGKCNSVFSCKLPELLQSSNRPLLGLVDRLLKLRLPEGSSSVWKCVSSTPMYYSTCASVCGQLMAVGGSNDSGETTSEVYQYDPDIQSWKVISHMTTTRHSCYVAVVDAKKILVLGGAGHDIDTVEIAFFSQ